MAVTNILLAGVGGQGVILASEILAMISAEEGYDVKQSEVHGVAQRGGAVVSHLRFGEKVHSPVCTEGEADLLFSMELLESLRWAHFLKKGGTAVVNDQKIEPVRFGKDDRPYPDGIPSFFSKKGYDFHLIDGYNKAKELGNFRAANIVMLGYMSRYLPFKAESWTATLKKRIPERFIGLNLEAFEAGKALKRK